MARALCRSVAQESPRPAPLDETISSITTNITSGMALIASEDYRDRKATAADGTTMAE